MGTVTFCEEAEVRVHLDAHLPGAEEWDNEVIWTWEIAGYEDAIEAAGADLRLITPPREGR